MKKKPEYKVGTKGRYGFFFPVWVTEITETRITIRDTKGNTKSVDKSLFDRHFLPVGE